MATNEASEKEKTPTAEDAPEFKRFATKRMFVGIVLVLAAMWVIATVLGLFSGAPDTHHSTDTHATAAHGTPETAAHPQTAEGHLAPGHDSQEATEHAAGSHDADAGHTASSGHTPDGHPTPTPATTAHGTSSSAHTAAPAPSSHHHPTQPSGSFTAADGHGLPSEAGHGSEPASAHGHAAQAPGVKGVAFVNAVTRPLKYELHERFWGWRPNDIIDFTDNVNNFQLGVLEVTRRTAVILAERISRAGRSEAFDKNLENAMNSLMVTADRYWFPSPEGKYQEALDEFAAYRDRLERGQARFWTRTDSLIPLLIAYEDLLGSCDENLVKAQEEDGSEVSFFAADDYFFYARGVASALYEILHAVEHDFGTTIEARRGSELLHHAIESCHHAIEIDPILITNSSLSGVLANHRANMAAPISHARFYLGVLIKTLST